MKPLPELLPELCLLARRAGDLIMQVYARPIDVRTKADSSPVTQADERAEALIVAGLASLAPGIPIVAEEAMARGDVPHAADRFWLVDPLDGTREFIARNGEFTVNIALIEQGAPVLGVVLAPAVGKLYAGHFGHGATLADEQGQRAIACRAPPQEGLTVMVSRSHDDPVAVRALLAGQKVASMKPAGSSLKLCCVAAGEADFYPRLTRTMEWDIAAGHAVLRAAGGRVCDLAGHELRYGKPGFENPAFTASGLAALPASPGPRA